MVLPNAPVTLSIEQIAQLNKMLSHMRHGVNNHFAVIVAAVELMRMNPALVQDKGLTVLNQCPKVKEEMDRFSAEFEKMLGIRRP